MALERNTAAMGNVVCLDTARDIRRRRDDAMKWVKLCTVGPMMPFVAAIAFWSAVMACCYWWMG